MQKGDDLFSSVTARSHSRYTVKNPERIQDLNMFETLQIEKL